MRHAFPRSYQFLLSLIVFLGVFTFFLNSTWANADRFVGQQWGQREQVSIARISHKSFDLLLKKYVDLNGFVDYRSWQNSKEDRNRLQQYLSQLSRANLGLPASRQDRLAYWINAYNALTIEGILQVYPTTSIRNHTPKVFGFHIWKNLKLWVGNRKFSLDEIEHQILRKMNEPRIHFAIVCASVSCPRLRNEAYVPDKIDAQLSKNAIDFFSRPNNLQIDQSRMKLKLSSILSWFAQDFGATKAKRIAFLKPFFPPEIQKILTRSELQLEYLPYNWNLNEQKRSN